jgi:hypothetical protein
VHNLYRIKLKGVHEKKLQQHYRKGLDKNAKARLLFKMGNFMETGGDFRGNTQHSDGNHLYLFML